MLTPSLSLACQQVQILGLTARGPVRLSDPLPGQDLVLQSQENQTFCGAPVARELEEAEDRWIAGIADAIPEGTEPRALLFGPGTSKTDPLYALRFLAKLALKTSRAGELAVYDLNANPQIYRYYSDLPWGDHRVHLELGSRGNFERLREQSAHLILAIHPSTLLDTLFGLFTDNLVRGGIGIYQASVNQEFAEEEDYRFFLNSVLALFKDTLEFAEPPIRSRLFRSYFSERSADVHVLAVKRK
ncbi:MAG TPA: hypothetical protein VFX30_12900 [bacterium]|nr:hypothetical protein [bacterium]